MPTRSSNLWIERKDRPQYLSYTATATGLRVRYADRLDPLVVDNINALIAFLRKRFFFPVRCNIYLTNHKRYSSQTDGHLFYGIFYDNEKVCEKKYIYPQIFVAADLHRHLTVEDVMFTLLHELTHYYQWLFDAENGRSDKCVEAEATKCANRILEDFKEAHTVNSPLGELRIFVDGEMVYYLPIITRFEHPTCKEHPLAACYRIVGAVKARHTVKCVIESATPCEVCSDSGEDYICQTFVSGNAQLTLGTVDSYACNGERTQAYDVQTIPNGFLFTNLDEKACIKLGVAWVTDRLEDDSRTWFAADPSEIGLN